MIAILPVNICIRITHPPDLSNLFSQLNPQAQEPLDDSSEALEINEHNDFYMNCDLFKCFLPDSRVFTF